MSRANHFPTHTKNMAIALNLCKRYVLVDILRMGTDCTNSGVTSPSRGPFSFFAPCPDGNFTQDDILATDRGFCLEVIPPAFPGCPFRFKVLGEPGRGMAGGNFAYTSDSRFNDVYGCPISVHDRHE